MESIGKILRTKLIPWSENAEERIIVARGEMRQSQMPSGVQLEKRRLKGSRNVVRNQRKHRDISLTSAIWPDAQLLEGNLLRLACITAGAVEYQLGKYAVRCDPGYFIVIPAGTPQPDGRNPLNIINLAKSTFCEIFSIHLYPNALQCWTCRFEKQSPQYRYGINLLFQDYYLIQQFRIFMESAISHEKNDPLKGKLFQAFVYLLQDNVSNDHYMETNTGAMEQLSTPSTVKKNFASELTSYIETHLQESPSLETAARAMFLSRTQFALKVRSETGKTYNELMNEQRLKIAKVLLLDTRWTIKTIASFIGYETPGYFRTMFHKNTGKTPSQYRKTQNEKKIKYDKILLGTITTFTKMIFGV